MHKCRRRRHARYRPTHNSRFTTHETMDDVDKRLVNDFQREFPLTPRPFAEVAAALGVSEDDVLARLRALQAAGAVSRVGAVFRPRRLGAGTLAAMAVPGARLAAVAELVSGYAEVNHNYEREHHYNLWVVATAADAETLARVLDDIERRTGIPVLRLPMLEDYHIDLGFALRWDNETGYETGATRRAARA
jgi:DNA-binding Lrp family transcriptional regulator